MKQPIRTNLAGLWAEFRAEFRAEFPGKFWKDRAGGVMIYSAVLAPVLLGFAGLSIDVGYWYANARLAQSAADSAAIAGSLEVLRSNGDAAQITAAAVSDAANNGFSASNGDSITVNTPPVSGQNAGVAGSVEVIVARPTQSFLSQFVFTGSTTVTARAVATADINDTCVWALNPTASSAVQVSGGAEVELDCGVFVNSSDSSALTQNGSGCLEASKIKVVGGYSTACATPEPTGAPAPIVDPLAPLAAPPYSGCDYSGNININGGQNQTLNPGTYCGKISVNSTGNATFSPGLYVLDGAALTIGGQATVSGVDVTFYLTANSGVSDNISVAGGATVSLSAPSDGILFYHDGNSPDNVTHSFTGGSSMDLDGILYFPNQAIRFAGGSDLASSEVLIIADTVEFTGNTEVELENGSSWSNPLLSEATLVE